MLKDDVIEAIAKVAYDAHVGYTEKNKDNYFQPDSLRWEELSDRAKIHWKNITKAVILASWNIDLGDLV